MSEHKNIVVRWKDAKLTITAELTRLEGLAVEIKADIKEQCGQNPSFGVSGPDRGRDHRNYEFRAGCYGYLQIVRAGGYLDAQLSGSADLLNRHLTYPISFVEEIAAFLKGIDGRRLREAAEASL